MSKKKKNIRRKKSNNLLKGVAAAGAVVGGGTIFAGNNAVYAAELDDETQVSDLSESQASTSSYMSESLSQSDSTTVDYASIENSTNASVSTSAYDSTVESEKNSIVESNSISDSVSLSESQLASISESESNSVSVSESESLVNSEAAKNDEDSSNKFGDFITGLLNGNKNVSAANYKTNTVENSTMPIAESGSVDPETSMSNYFKESESLSNSLTSTYGKSLAGEVLSDKAYVIKSNDDLIKEGVLVQKGDKFVYTYITSKGKTKTIELTKNNVKIDKTTKIVTSINWDGYFIQPDGTIEPTYSFTDYNDQSGNKVFMNVQGKDVYVVRQEIDGKEYWVPVKVNGNYVEVQNGGEKVRNTDLSFFDPNYGTPYVQIKIDGEKYYLDGAEIENNIFFALRWDVSKTKYNKLYRRTEFTSVILDESYQKRAIDDMNVSKPSYSETNSKVVSESNSFSMSKSTSLSLSTSSSLSVVASTSASISASQSASASESASVSASGSTSESVNTSESISESISESLSVSESESISGSMSDSVSTSTAVSESLSTSLSLSESNSLSSSESASASDSFATSVTTTTTGGDTTYRRVVVDTRAPLQVAPRVTEEEVVEDETPKANLEKETETIEKEKMPKSTLDVTHRVWWSWVPIVGALVSLVNAHASKKARNDASKERNDASKEKEDK